MPKKKQANESINCYNSTKILACLIHCFIYSHFSINCIVASLVIAQHTLPRLAAMIVLAPLHFVRHTDSSNIRIPDALLHQPIPRVTNSAILIRLFPPKQAIGRQAIIDPTAGQIVFQELTFATVTAEDVSFFHRDIAIGEIDVRASLPVSEVIAPAALAASVRVVGLVSVSLVAVGHGDLLAGAVAVVALVGVDHFAVAASFTPFGLAVRVAVHARAWSASSCCLRLSSRCFRMVLFRICRNCELQNKEEDGQENG